MAPELEIKAMKEFYVTISRYLISHLPIDDILKHLEILHPLMQHEHGTTKRLEKFPAKELSGTAKVHETSEIHRLSPDYITWECRCRNIPLS